MIINFGKYKGQHISSLKADTEYCKWLTSTAEKDPQSFVANFVRNYLNNTHTKQEVITPTRISQNVVEKKEEVKLFIE